MESVSVSHVVAGLRWLGWHTLFAIALLWLACAGAAWQLSDLIRGFDVGLQWQFVTFALLLGWLLARTSCSLARAALFALTFSFVVVFVRVGQLHVQLSALANALASAEASLLWSHQVPGLAATLQSAAELLSALLTLVVRTHDWLLAAANGQSVTDPVALMIVWGVCLSLLSAWAAFVVGRESQPLKALLPLVVVMSANAFYARAFPSALLIMMSVLLALQVTLSQRAREQRWRAAMLDYSDEIRFDLALHVAPIWIGVVCLALVMPSLSIYDALRNVRAWFVAPIGTTLPIPAWLGSPQSESPPSPFEAVRVGGLPRKHLIGSGPELSKQIVMIVKSDDDEADHAPRYYWRALTYDRYTGAGWLADEGQTVAIRAGDPIQNALPSQRRVTQDVQFVGEFGGLLHAAGQVSAVDHDVRVARRADDDVFGALVDVSTYRAQSLVPNVTESALRAADNVYPDAIANRYLALPDDVPPRVRALARDLTATAPTPYDRARAIGNYLRAFSYTLDLPAPPSNRDVVDYFLFDLRKGYCDYYATAMVVLARAAGLPARLVVGYASGTYDAANARFVVSAADAHSWAEVYFADVGWIEFEPTPARPAFDYQTEPLPASSTPPLAPAVFDIGGVLTRVLWLTFAAIGFVVSVSVAWFVSEPLRLRRLDATERVRAIYARLLAHAARLHIALHRGDTPYEVAAALSQRMAQLHGHSQDDGRALHAFVELYVRAAFSPQRISASEAAHALALWQRLRVRLWWLWLRQTMARNHSTHIK